MTMLKIFQSKSIRHDRVFKIVQFGNKLKWVHKCVISYRYGWLVNIGDKIYTDTWIPQGDKQNNLHLA